MNSSQGSAPDNAAEREIVRQAIVRLHSRVMALVFAMVGGTGLLLVTAWHVLRKEGPRAPDIGLLANYFPGYEVSWGGALIGFGYGALSGALLGWVVAQVYNRVASRNGSL